MGTRNRSGPRFWHYFHATFDIDEKLYDTLKYDDTFYLRADRLRHPLIFYFGHTATFYINKLTIARVIDTRINPRFESMFAVGVDEMSWDDLDEAHYDWPTRQQVKEYRDQVRALDRRADPHPAADPPDHLGEPVLGDHDGDRTPAHPSGNIVGADPPAPDRPGAAAATLGHLPRSGRTAGQPAACRCRRHRHPRQGKGSSALRLG